MSDPIAVALAALRERHDELQLELEKVDTAIERLAELCPEERPKPRRKPGPKPKHASSTNGHAPVGESRDLVLAALPHEWTRVSDIIASSGLSAVRVRAALTGLRSAGLAENNGQVSRNSRWRAKPKGKRSKAAGIEPATEEERPAPRIIHRDVKPPKPFRRLPLVPEKPGDTAFRMTDGSVLSLEVVAVDALAKPEQRFKCVPFSAIITAETCLKRQAIVGADVRIGRGKEAGDRTREIDATSKARQFARCANCALGGQVRARLEAA